MRTTLHRYVLRETVPPFLAALAFLTQLFFVMRLLSQADVIFGSGVRPADVGAVLLFLAPSMLSYGMPVAFLLGLLVGLGRLADDRELTALAATGHGPHVLLPAPLATGVVLTCVMLAITTWLEPLGLAHARARMNDVIKRNLAGDVKPGVFHEDLPELTLFAGAGDAGGALRELLVYDARDPAAPLLVLAGAGRIDTSGETGAITLRLSEGELHRAVQRGDDYALAQFGKAEVAVVVEQELKKKNKMLRPMETSPLSAIAEQVEVRRAQGKKFSNELVEYHRRIAHPFVMAAFAFVGVAAAATVTGARRGGRGAAYAITLGAVVAYFVLGKLFAAGATGGQLPAFLGAWGPVLTVAAGGAGWLAWRRARGGAS